MVDLPTIQDIFAAQSRIAAEVFRTPLLRSSVLDELSGGQIFLKPECLQRTGSFKFRGAYNAVSANLEQARNSGVFACSSGNHAQGIAEVCRLLNVAATILMPSDAPAIKLARTRRSGANVIFYDRATEDREALSLEWVEKSGAVFIHPYQNPLVIAGQGTLGLEIAEDLQEREIELNIASMPTGGGGMAAGVNLALTHHFPEIAVHPAEPVGFDDYARSLVAGKILSNAQTSGSICDAIISPAPGDIGFAINSRNMAPGVTVTDEEALYAVGFAQQELKIVVEPGGAVALAAVLSGKLDVKGKTAALVLSGGNIDPDILTDAMGRYSITD